MSSAGIERSENEEEKTYNETKEENQPNQLFLLKGELRELGDQSLENSVNQNPQVFQLNEDSVKENEANQEEPQYQKPPPNHQVEVEEPQEPDLDSENKPINQQREKTQEEKVEKSTTGYDFGVHDSDDSEDEIEHLLWNKSVYFGDDFKELSFKKKHLDIFKYYKYQTNINFWYFCEAFILHYLHMGLLGPFIYIIAFFYWPYFRLFSNMGFLTGIPGLLQWLASVSILYARYDREFEVIDNSFIAMVNIIVIARSGFIAAKYATFTSEYRCRLLNRFIKGKEVGRWLLFGGWRSQKRKIIERELNYALQRKYVDKATFKLCWIDEPNPEIKTKLTDASINPRWVENGTKFKMGSKTLQYYDCRMILYWMIQEHKKTKTNYLPMIFVLLTTIGLISIPGLSRRYTGHKEWAGDILGGQIIFWYSTLIGAFTFLASCIGFDQAYKDLSRIDFCLRQLWQMCSPVRIASVGTKLFPTINLADPVSLQAWLNMRKVVYEYGAGFLVRHNFYIPLTFIISFSCFIFIITHSVVMDTFEADHVTRMQAILGYLGVVFGFIHIALIRVCQRINQNYEAHLRQIRENQQIYQSLHHFRDYYIKGNQDKEIPFNVNQIFSMKPLSRAHQKITEFMKSALGLDYEEHCDPLVEKLVAMQDEFSHEIDRQDEYHARTFMGVRVNFAVTGFVWVGYFCCIFYGYLIGFYSRDSVK